MPKVGVVVVTYNRRDLLLRSLQAILAQTLPLHCILVIDNASTDGTGELLRARGMLDEPSLHYRPLAANLGGAGGFHLGLDWALELDCEWVWLMDDDALPEPDALERLLAQVPETKTPPIMAGRVVDGDGHTYLGPRARLAKSSLKVMPVPEEEYSRPFFDAELVSFVGPLIHRSQAAACGLPRADFFIYYDDFEYTHRLWRAGFRIRVVPDSRIVHLDGGRSIGQAMEKEAWGWQIYYRNRNRIVWLRDISPGYVPLLFRMAQLFVRELGQIILFQPARLQRGRMLMRAFADGWRGRLGKTVDPATYTEAR